MQVSKLQCEKHKASMKRTNHLQNSVGPCSLCMSGRLHSDYGDDLPHHTSHENTMRSGIQRRSLGIPLHQYNSCLKEYDCHSMVLQLLSSAVKHVNC